MGMLAACLGNEYHRKSLCGDARRVRPQNRLWARGVALSGSVEHSHDLNVELSCRVVYPENRSMRHRLIRANPMA